jgi:hypothetical protein
MIVFTNSSEDTLLSLHMTLEAASFPVSAGKRIIRLFCLKKGCRKNFQRILRLNDAHALTHSSISHRLSIAAFPGRDKPA